MTDGPDRAPRPDIAAGPPTGPEASTGPGSGSRIPVAAGLCARCLHARQIVSGRGSRFVLCERSRTDPHFPRYPALPVRSCAGFQPPP